VLKVAVRHLLLKRAVRCNGAKDGNVNKAWARNPVYNAARPGLQGTLSDRALDGIGGS